MGLAGAEDIHGFFDPLEAIWKHSAVWFIGLACRHFPEVCIILLVQPGLVCVRRMHWMRLVGPPEALVLSLELSDPLVHHYVGAHSHSRKDVHVHLRMRHLTYLSFHRRVLPGNNMWRWLS